MQCFRGFQIADRDGLEEKLKKQKNQVRTVEERKEHVELVDFEKVLNDSHIMSVQRADARTPLTNNKV